MLEIWNFGSGSDFYVSVTIDMSFCFRLPNFVQSYDVISIFQDGGQGIAILLPVSVFVTSLIWEGRNLPEYQISERYLNSRQRYYYFRLLKTNVHHVGILLPVAIFMFASPSACHFASTYQTSSKSDHPRRSYDVISISQDGGRQPY